MGTRRNVLIRIFFESIKQNRKINFLSNIKIKEEQWELQLNLDPPSSSSF